MKTVLILHMIYTYRVSFQKLRTFSNGFDNESRKKNLKDD